MIHKDQSETALFPRPAPRCFSSFQMYFYELSLRY